MAGSRISVRQNLREQVYERIKSSILLGATPKHLVEEDLARTLGVSRTPVREALNRLRQEQLIEIVPRRGAKVLPRTVPEFLSLLEIREVLEGLAARLAAARVAPADIRQMRALFEAFRGYADRNAPDKSLDAKYAKANVLFHRMIVTKSGNPALARMLANLYDHMRFASKYQVIARLDRRRASFYEHMQIIDALEAHDAERARQLSEAHIRDLRLAAQKGLESLDDRPDDVLIV